ncbi:protein ROOT PRIMORDIUM DEFECTIVE 1 [Amborella trichopoda]|uniref:PORR domain-containing protein n=1 Tax=Amborella trichopoda TaxID=13333 RepID=U5D9Z9_AMBTC|nr:protein ROOT PRIMORDIUM DEFECTIVE 1 [Amborella trichopoda]XP_020531378.1 protein ROOT PRIMORDIUM DEFECTIVE 1 [Amborella trichopoda]XP_020531379.1 protein ROOT PRIMORDIUM DEFECTIVE 1 [Amborella trichopoda]ERN19334.1 hypothetical protein AMTR_s00069p00092600 [Amborella trichopoda]|eukprot:XP_006857867.1 protein ROOT PRIMORDIUM DEFECTIVE 1 [Amborella trichopoda]
MHHFFPLRNSLWKRLGFSLSPLSIRPFSQAICSPKKLERVRDHGYDNYMEVQKKIIKTLKFQDLILSQPSQTICIARLDALARRFGLKQFEAGAFVLKFPHVFEIYEHPVQRILFSRLTKKALDQFRSENQALVAQLPEAINRLRKLLMVSNSQRLRLEHVRVARRDLGLPDDFEFTILLKFPQYFRLIDSPDPRSKYIELVEKDPNLAICAIERAREMEYRTKGKDAENIRFAFIINFPPGFKIGKYYKIAVWKWQRLPYWSPYEDVSGYDLRSIEAQKRMEKRAVAMIHEILSLTVEKKITLERIAHFRNAMNLPKKLKEFLLQHQGIFYISTRGNHGKLHTVFLREAYRKGELIEPNDLYLARRRLAELIMMSPRKMKLGEDLGRLRRERDDDRGIGFERESWDGGDLDNAGSEREDGGDTGPGMESWVDGDSENSGSEREDGNDIGRERDPWVDEDFENSGSEIEEEAEIVFERD